MSITLYVHITMVKRKEGHGFKGGGQTWEV